LLPDYPLLEIPTRLVGQRLRAERLREAPGRRQQSIEIDQ
jgi:hypothetical protein